MGEENQAKLCSQKPEKILLMCISSVLKNMKLESQQYWSRISWGGKAAATGLSHCTVIRILNEEKITVSTGTIVRTPEKKKKDKVEPLKEQSYIYFLLCL